MEQFPLSPNGLPEFADTVFRVQEIQRLMELAQGTDAEDALARAGRVVEAADSLCQKGPISLSESVQKEIEEDKRELARLSNIAMGLVGIAGGGLTTLQATDGNMDSALFTGAYTAGLMVAIKSIGPVCKAVERFQLWNQKRKQSHINED